ncbi:MAG: hypothetical protein H5U24_01950 [Thioclava marina]|jgi:hypothetical protein|uniref:hypothetical protein n=1 Tax=Thioclava marina TaxID=1915077 RepID=UPI0019A5EA0C|nr:hypothetical protein [Thioclava marina]MBC7144148.1 hypothetical protein [Thioclava marina]
MILSHAHRFIFLHNRKTAGSSISVALARYLGPEDLQLSAIVETLREGIPLTVQGRPPIARPRRSRGPSEWSESTTPNSVWREIPRTKHILR